ncbi:MAG: HTH domain-containing protein [Candidatus Berkelbacteria bacterium]|nr:HTH domain-containing protein [Candidatus Berkelbacteria bacterium]
MSETKENSTRGKNLVEIIGDLMLVLNEKEKRAITGRFGITGKKETLSAIGRELHLSRERVRQIEKNALRKMSALMENDFSEMTNKIVGTFDLVGGVVADDEISEEFLKLANEQKFAKNYLRLACTIIFGIDKINESDKIYSGWKLASTTNDKILSTLGKIIEYFKKEDIPQQFEGLKTEIPALAKMDANFVLSCIYISKKLIMAKNGMIGLTSWPSVNPRNVRDKIYYVLKTTGSPLHFTEITSGIAALEFDKKKVVRATVHNELIADNRFVLIGRGIYALREWGYSDGTVCEVIKNILSNSKKPISSSEIIELVNKSRKVKKNTIVINLQTKKEFKKVDGGYVYEKL